MSGSSKRRSRSKPKEIPRKMDLKNAIRIKPEPLDEDDVIGSVRIKIEPPDCKRLKTEPEDVEEDVLGPAAIALTNHTIIKQVLLCFDLAKLLEVSRVSKVWCSTARSVIRNTKKKCIVRIEGFDPCMDLLMLDKTLEESADHPFTGLALNVYLTRRTRANPKHCCIGKQTQLELSENFSSILNKLPFHHLEIDWDKKSPCPASSLLIHILKCKRKELTELKISYLPSKIKSLSKALGVKKDSPWLPNVKILDLCGMEGMKSVVKHEIITAAPKLQTLYGQNTIHDLDFFLKCKKVSVVQQYCFYYDDHKYDDEGNDGMYRRALVKFGETNPQLSEFIFCGYRHAAFRYDSALADTATFINMHLRPLFESVLATLEIIDLTMSDLLFVLPEILKTHSLMPKLKRMNLRKFEFRERFNGKTIFQEVSWKRFFPILETLILWITEDSEEVQQTFLSGATDLNVCCTPTVKEIIVKAEGEPFDFRNFIIESFNGMGDSFPNVERFTLVGGLDPAKIFPFLWTTWPKMHSIVLRDFPMQWENLDPIFCGISEAKARCFYRPKKIDELRKEYFKPLSPSILSLKELQTFRVLVRHRCHCGWDRPIGMLKDQIFITHVTVGLALARMPGLFVEIVRDVCASETVGCGFTLEHLRPYVRITD